MKDILNKYWIYRNRLKNNFLFQSDNNDAGSNIPVDRIVKKDEKVIQIVWDDCNGALPYYIILLATEYKLFLNRLKKDGVYWISQTKKTLNELENAILAINRLDLYADNKLDGVFRRSDILYINSRSDNDVFGKWTPLYNYFDLLTNTKPSYRFAERVGNKSRYNSIDNIIKFIEADAIVTKLLDTEESIPIAKLLTNSVKRMLINTYHANSKRKWYLINPETNKIIPSENGGGADLYTIATSYGLSLYSKKLGLNYIQEKYGKGLFSLLMKTKLSFLNKSFWMIRALATVNNISFGYENTYQYLLKAENLYTKKLEQYPLFWCILNDQKLSSIDSLKLYELLNKAPENGPYNILNEDKAGNRSYDFEVEEWSCPSRFVWPELIGNNGTNSDNWKRHGYFNGIDYMVLHNLYYLLSDIEFDIIEPTKSISLF